MSNNNNEKKKYENLYFKKLYISPYNIIRRKSSPLRIGKKISDMKYCVDQIYHKFCLYATDMKKKKQVEEWLKLKRMKQIRRMNFIKDVRILFKTKKPIQLYKSKSVKNIIKKNLYSKIFLKLPKKIYNNKIQFQPYLYPIKKEDTMKLKCITDPNMKNLVKKSINNNKTKESLILSNNKKKFRKSVKIMKSGSTLNNKPINKINNNIFIMQKTLSGNSSKILVNRKTLMTPKSSNNNYNRYTLSFQRYNNKNNDLNKISNNNSIKINDNNKRISKHKLEKIKTLLEIKKSARELLPLLSYSFNSTLNKSQTLKKHIHHFQKEARTRSSSSRQKKIKIVKRFFKNYEVPSIKNSLGYAKKKKFRKIKNENIKMIYDIQRKPKSPLIFVEDYNRMRNRRRKNYNFGQNLGVGVNSGINDKYKKSNFFLGMTFNYAK